MTPGTRIFTGGGLLGAALMASGVVTGLGWSLDQSREVLFQASWQMCLIGLIVFMTARALNYFKEWV